MGKLRDARSSFSPLLLLLLASAGCRHHAMMVHEADLTTPDMTIVGEHFKIESGKTAEVPFALEPRKFDSNDNLVESYKDAIEDGAQRVTVSVQGRDAPLHGVIAFYSVPDSASGPGSRSMSIQIDPSYIAGASDGRVSVVYELVPFDKGRAFTWILWLSDRPF